MTEPQLEQRPHAMGIVPMRLEEEVDKLEDSI